jgi:hypothetical protein
VWRIYSNPDPHETPKRNTSPVLISDPLSNENMLGKSSDRGARPKEPSSLTQTAEYTDEV